MVCSFFIPKKKGVRKIATTGIWKIEKRLDNVIDYTTNIEKTINSDYGKDSYYDLHNVIDYVEADYKTEKQFYVSGVNCNPKTALEEMTITKEQYGKTGGILGFHAFQSFAEGEVTPEQCHAIGVRLAEEMWGDRFEVVVSTHLNTNHYHNHFVINSVSYIDGKRYYDNRESYAKLRLLNDTICKEYGLSYLEEKETRKGIDYTKYQNIDYSNYYSKTKKDIDYFISVSSNYEEFINNLKDNNYSVIYRADKLSIRHNDYKRNIRIERKFGKDYTIENIVKRIKGIYIPENNYYRNSYKKDKTLEVLLKTNSKSLAYLYIKYLKLLNNYPKQSYSTKLSYELRKEIDKMDMISKEVNLLVNNNIECEDDLHSFYLNLEKSKNYEEIKLCEDIMKRNKTLYDNIEKLEKEVIIR